MKSRQRGRPTKWVYVSVGGLRWLPAKGKARRRRTWSEVADWLGSL